MGSQSSVGAMHASGRRICNCFFAPRRTPHRPNRVHEGTLPRCYHLLAAERSKLGRDRARFDWFDTFLSGVTPGKREKLAIRPVSATARCAEMLTPGQTRWSAPRLISHVQSGHLPCTGAVPSSRPGDGNRTRRAHQPTAGQKMALDSPAHAPLPRALRLGNASASQRCRPLSPCRRPSGGHPSPIPRRDLHRLLAEPSRIDAARPRRRRLENSGPRIHRRISRVAGHHAE